MARKTHNDCSKPHLKEEVLSAIQSLTLELHNNRQQHVALSNRMDQLNSILEKPLSNSEQVPKAPVFNGDNPSGWIQKVQSYFDHFGTSQKDRLWLVGLLFEHRAWIWLDYQNKNNFLTSWPEFLESVKQSFDRPRDFIVTGTASGMSVETLISFKSRHNFIHPDMAEKLGLEVTPIKPFRVHVGNGESLNCDHKCDRTKLMIQGHEVVVDLFVVRIHGSDVVLGAQWLYSLGTLSIKYGDLTMAFMHNDKVVMLRADWQSGREISCFAMKALCD